MVDEPAESSSGQDDLKFPSKRDAWLVGVLWLVILASAAGAVYAFTLSLSLVPLCLQEIMWIGVIAFSLSILRSTYYTIKIDCLEVRSGPFKWTIQFVDIEEIVPSRKAWSSAALSMDRLYINHKGPAGGTYISPEDKAFFLETIAARAQTLVLKGDRVVKVDSVKEI